MSRSNPEARSRPRAPRGYRLPGLLLAAAVLAGLALPPEPPPAPSSPPALPPAEREIRDGDTHTDAFQLAAGEFLGAIVEQIDADVVVKLIAPDGEVLSEMDSAEGCWWEDEVAAVAPRAGLYRIAVSPWEEGVPPGRYRIRVSGPRPATGLDRLRVEAVKLNHQADTRRDTAEEPGIRRQALALWRQIGDRRREAEILHQLGGLSGDEGETLLFQAEAIWRELGDTARRSKTLNRLALLYLNRDEPRQAIAYSEEALRLARQAGSAEPEAIALNNLGFAYDDLSEKQRALEYLQQGLAAAKRVDRYPIYESSALLNLGDLLQSLGEWDAALSHYSQALEITRRLPATQARRRREASLLNNRGLLLERMGQPRMALPLVQESLRLAQEAGDAERQAAAVSLLAFLYIRLGEPTRALDLGHRALQLAGESGDLEAAARQALGAAYRAMGRPDDARIQLTLAYNLSRERVDPFRESQVILELARVARDGDDLRAALAHLEKGIRIVEAVRSQVISEDLRASFLASRQIYYELHVDTLMTLHRREPQAGHAAAALRASEARRARNLLDTLSRAGLADSDPAALTPSSPLSVSEIQARVIDGEALLLEYSLGEERSYLWAVSPGQVQGYELPGRARIEEMARRFYAGLTARNTAPARGREADAAAAEAAGELGRILLAPVADLLRGQPLLIVADGSLQYVPFAALPLPGQPRRTLLIERHEVVSLPSASVLAVLRRELAGRPAAPKTLALLADPVFSADDPRVLAAARPPQVKAPAPRGPALRGEAPAGGSRTGPRKLRRLHYSKDEAEAIAALVPEGKRFKALGFDATRAAVAGGALKPYRIVHFATHGLIDSQNPEQSSLVLSLVDKKGKPQDGHLRLADIYNLDLDADLVVLSACQTALGKEIRGEGLVGLTRGFMYAGAARVVASLWSVDDRATSKLMQRFYQHMIQDQLRPAAALRRAQLELARDPHFQSPYYWAGFSLQGEWR